MIGVSIARSTRSGSGDGPGICRKWRPTGREEFFGIVLIPGMGGLIGKPQGFHAVPRSQLAAMKDECESQSRLLADRGANVPIRKLASFCGTSFTNFGIEGH